MSKTSDDGVSIYAKLRQMDGILNDIYVELGGAERAIQEERDGYSRSARPNEEQQK